MTIILNIPSLRGLWGLQMAIFSKIHTENKVRSHSPTSEVHGSLEESSVNNEACDVLTGRHTGFKICNNHCPLGTVFQQWVGMGIHGQYKINKMYSVLEDESSLETN